MTKFEDRLRAAMESSVASEQPPRGLVELVRRRHRRHMALMAVAPIVVLIAAAAAIAPARSALLGRGTTPVLTPSSPGPSHAGVIRRGQYYGCGSQTLGALGPHWRQGATHAGPVWFVNRGIAPDFRFRNPDGTLKAVPLIVLVRDNTTAWVKPHGSARRDFRFLPGFNGTNRYTLRDGKADATFASCSSQAAMYGSGLTEYYIGIIVTGPRCIPVDVQTLDAGHPARATLHFGQCTTR